MSATFPSSNSLVRHCLSAFNGALKEIQPNNCVQKAVSLKGGNKLTIANRTYQMAKNVHLVAIGKAAPSMVEGAERALGTHLVDGIASVPMGSQIASGLKTQFLTGAEHNLPDERAMANAEQIESFVRSVRGPDEIILFLISGGGSALLPSPVSGITLDEKVELIRQLQRSGADIKQLNTVRTALSRLKGGGLARLGYPSKMLSLIISDIVGDPIELISSGPTVVPIEPRDPIAVLNQLGLQNKVDKKLLEVLEKAKHERKKQSSEAEKLDVNNLIVASNSTLLQVLADQLTGAGLTPIMVTKQLEGDASQIGQSMAKFVEKLSTADFPNDWKQLLAEERLLTKNEEVNMEAQHIIHWQSNKSKIVFLFGGESTVCFDPKKDYAEAKGGRNQEMVLSAFREFLMRTSKSSEHFVRRFALFSLGSDGQDGPTDATGAFITSEDLPADSGTRKTLQDRIQAALDTKCSYQFWSKFNGGQNLVKTGKTGVNFMDVQMLAIDFSGD